MGYRARVRARVRVRVTRPSFERMVTTSFNRNGFTRLLGLELGLGL